MTRPRARFTGQVEWRPFKPFPQALRSELSAVAGMDASATHAEPEFDTRAEQFVALIESQAQWAHAELQVRAASVKRSEAQAEIAHLLRLAVPLYRGFATLSPEVDRAYCTKADPLEVTDALSGAIDHLSAIANSLDHAPPKKRKKVVGPLRLSSEHDVAVEFAIRVLQVLAEYGISTAITFHPEYGIVSPLIRIVKLAGDHISFCRSLDTWRNTVIQAKTYLPE